jgi:competence protein ComEC
MRILCLSLICLFLTGVLEAEEARLVALDVGEGQAILIQSGEHGILMDTGHVGKARLVLDRLADLGVHQLDYLILSHLHPDHASGYFRLREAWPATPVLYNGQPLPAMVQPDITRWVNDALLTDPLSRVIRVGEIIHWRGMRLEVLWPDGFETQNLNRHSLVIRLDYQGYTALIMGDADNHVEQMLLNQHSKLPSSVDVLVLGHHGARDAGSEPFLRRLNPGLAIISVNANNLRGYPDAAVLQRLADLGISLRRTDRDGEIRIELSGPQSAAGK